VQPGSGEVSRDNTHTQGSARQEELVSPAQNAGTKKPRRSGVDLS